MVAGRSTSPRNWATAGLGLLVALCCLAALVSVAQAHALLVRSLPEADAEMVDPPQTIEMWFSEPLESQFSNAYLVDSAGEEIATGASMVDAADPTHMTLPLAELEPGIYTVVWRTLSSVDGHEWVGSFPITVLNPDGSRPASGAATIAGGQRGELPTPAEAVARWLSLLGAIFVAGAVLFRAIAAQPLFRRSERPTLRVDLQPLPAAVQSLVEIGMVLGALAVLVGGWLQLGVQSLSLGGLADLPDLLLATRPGTLVLYRQLLLGALLLVVISAAHTQRLRRWRWWLLIVVGSYTGLLLIVVVALAVQNPTPLVLLAFGLGFSGAGLALLQVRSHATYWTPLTRWAAILVSAAILVTLSLGSHAAAVAGSGWAILGDFVHLVAAAAWLGGLVLLAVLLWQIRAHLPAIDGAELGAVVRRFSYLAGFSVFVLAVTGLFSSLVQLPSLDFLWTTTYGRLLLGKLFLVALALGIALLNNRLVHKAAPAGDPPDHAGRFLRQLLGESAVGVGILIVVAVLVQTPVPQIQPVAPASVVESAFNHIVAVDDLLIHMQISPNQVGSNRFWTHLYHADGSPIGEVQLVRLFFVHQEADLGQAQIDLEALGQDTFAAEGAYLNQPGPWDVSVYVRRRGLDDTLADTSVDVPAPAGVTPDRNPWQNPIAGLPAGMVVGGLFVVLGLVPLLWYRPLLRMQRRVYPVFATLGALSLVAGLVTGYAALPTAASPAALAGASPPVTAESIAAGSELYQTHCASCHGPYGLGNGPAAASLPVPPAVLVFHVPEHNDAVLYSFISKGFPDLGMPAFGEQLSQEEIWQILHYLRDQFGEER